MQSQDVIAAMMAVINCLVSELDEKGLIDRAALIERVQTTAVAFREYGGRKEIADAIHELSEFLIAEV